MKLLSALVLSLSLFAAPAFAAVSYDNIGATYQYVDTHNGDNADVGAAVSLSKTLGETLFVRASVDHSDFNPGAVDTYRIGLGAKVDFSDTFSAYGVGYGLKSILSAPGGYQNADYSSWGYGAEGGARWLVASSLEVRAGAATERFTKESSWETFGVVGATLRIAESVFVTGDVKLNDNFTQANVGLQYQF